MGAVTTLKRLQKIIFQVFVFLLPTQLGKHFWPEWSKIFGIRVDYLSPTMYLTDLFVAVLFLVWIIEFMFIEDNSLSKLKQFIKKYLSVILLSVLFVFINIKSSAHYEASIIKWAKVLEMGFVSFFIYSSREFRVKTWLLKPMLLSLFYVGLLMILQIFFQQSINGFFYYLGERHFNTYSSSIALVNLFGRQLLRPYSTFSHPNSLAGFLAVVLVLTWLKRGFLNRGKPLVFIVLTALLLLTFSLNVYISLLILGVFAYVFKKHNSIFKPLIKVIFWITIVVSLALPIVGSIFKERNISESFDKRLELSVASGEMIKEHFFLGVGLNNFIYQLPETSIKPQTSWWLQPVHNIFLLVFVEIGILGLLAFIYLMKNVIERDLIAIKSDNSRDILLMALVVIILSGFNDHYWLTIQQNQLLFSVVLGLSFREKLY
jgi:O-antigen ligase